MRKLKYLLFILFMFIGMSSVKANCYYKYSDGYYRFQNTPSSHGNTAQYVEDYTDKDGFCVIPKKYTEKSATCIYNDGKIYDEFGIDTGTMKSVKVIYDNQLNGKISFSYYDPYSDTINTIDITKNSNYFFDENGQFKCKNFILHSAYGETIDDQKIIIDNNKYKEKFTDGTYLIYYNIFSLKEESYACVESKDEDTSKNYVEPLNCSTFTPTSYQEYIPSNAQLCIDSKGSLFYNNLGKYEKIENYIGTSGELPNEVCLERTSANGQITYYKDCKKTSSTKDIYRIVEQQTLKCYVCSGQHTWLYNLIGVIEPENCTIVENIDSKSACEALNNSGTSGTSGTQTEGEIPKWHIDHSEDVACGTVINIPKQLPAMSTLFVNLIKILTPTILIILGLIDIFKAVMSSDENEIQKGKKKFLRRLLPAALVFFVITFAQLIFGLVGTNTEYGTFVKCANCFLNYDCEENTGTSFLETDANKGYSGSKSNGTGVQEKISNSEANVRNTVTEFAKWTVNALNDNFIYLYPRDDERNASNLTEISGVGSVSGGSCSTKTYKGNTCITKDSKKYYGTDCNGFVAMIYHNSLKIGNDSSYRFFTPSTSEWNIVGEAGVNSYFNKDTHKYTNIDDVIKNAKPGDAVGRVCGNSTHIAIYVGDSKFVDNMGWYNSTSSYKRLKPLRIASKNDFIGSHNDCSFTLLKLTGFTTIEQNKIVSKWY